MVPIMKARRRESKDSLAGFGNRGAGRISFQAGPMWSWGCLRDAKGVIHTSPGHSPWVHRPKHDFKR